MRNSKNITPILWEMAEQVVAESERWFFRNLGDTDVNMVGQ